MHQPGNTVVEPLPPGVQNMTIFTGGVASAGARPDAVRPLLAWMAGPAADAARAPRHVSPVIR